MDVLDQYKLLHDEKPDLFQAEAAYSHQKLDLNNYHNQLVLASLYLRMAPTQQIQSLLQDKHSPYIEVRHKVL